MQQATYIRDNTYIEVGHPAYVTMVEHPKLSPGAVRTSTVQSYDPVSGVFVTRNTTYTPHQGEQA